VAADSGLDYLPIYLGPIIIAPSWILILKKSFDLELIKFQVLPIFFSFAMVIVDSGAIVTVICFDSSICLYIGLQLKAISETFHVVTKTK
jgi:Na+/proline symporter